MAAGLQPNAKAFDRSVSMPGKESVVVLVVSDPEPDDLFALQDTDGSKVAGDTNGVDWPSLAYALELKTRVARVEYEGPIRFPGLLLDFTRKHAKQVPEPGVRLRLHIFSGSRTVVRAAAESATASSASASRASWDWANRRFHSFSDSSSDCSHPAIRSCSSGGRDDSCEKTVSRARVMRQAYSRGDCRTRRCSTAEAAAESSGVTPTSGARRLRC